MKQIFLLSILALVLPNVLFAQSDIFSSKYIFNPMFFNPANTGINGETEFVYSMKSGLRFRQPEIPNKEILSVSVPIKGQRWRLGVSAMHQDFFLTNDLMIKPSAAYFIGFSGGSQLSLGVSTSLTRLRIDEIQFTTLIPAQSKFYPNAEVGFFYKSNFGYLGFAERGFNKQVINITGMGGNEIPIRNLLKESVLSGGINCFRFMNGLIIRPSFSLTRIVESQFVNSEILRAELNLEIELYNRFNFGTSYRNTNVLGSPFFIDQEYVDAWFGYKDREKKFMLITNWKIEEPIFLNRFTAELLFGYTLNPKSPTIIMTTHFF